VAYVETTILVSLLISTRSQYKKPPLQHTHYKLDDDHHYDDDDNNNNNGKSRKALKRASNWYRTFSVNAAT